ncbi:MAG: AI-2E family transporter [Bacteroidales bacterium]|nr:AI-2E family transporter [Bacteroidales bacterium]
MSKQLKLWITIIGFLIVALLCWYFSEITAYIITALVLTLITQPLLKKMDSLKIKKFKIPHGVNVCLIILLILILFFGFLFAFAPLIISQVNMISKIQFVDFSDKFRGSYTIIHQYIVENGMEDLLIKAEHTVMDRIQDFISLDKLGEIFSGIFSFTGSFAMGLFSILFITFFLLKDNLSISKKMINLLPKAHRHHILETYHKIKNLLTRYFVGILCELASMMTLEIIGLTIFGIPNALLIGFLGGLFNVIPYLGPLIGGTVGVLLALIATMASGVYTGLGWIAITVIAVFVVSNLIDNIVLQPIIYSKSVKAHPLEIFIVIIMGGNIAGITGMILAIPAYTVIRTIVLAFVHNKNLVRRFTDDDMDSIPPMLRKANESQPQ